MYGLQLEPGNSTDYQEFVLPRNKTAGGRPPAYCGTFLPLFLLRLGRSILLGVSTPRTPSLILTVIFVAFRNVVIRLNSMPEGCSRPEATAK
jgi:hypothetical protein